MSGWLAFWGDNPSIYVSEAHLRAHYAVLGRDLPPLVGGRGRLVLDFGCGDALATDALVASGATVLLYDATPSVRDRLARRFGSQPAVQVLDEAGWEALPDAAVDAVLVNSVLQYLDRPTFEMLLARWRRVLRPGGELLLCDVVPPQVSPLADAKALLVLALRSGFVSAALAGLVRTALSDYPRLRRQLGFSCYDEAEILGILRHAGFSAERLARNVGPTPHRMSFRARPV